MNVLTRSIFLRPCVLFLVGKGLFETDLINTSGATLSTMQGISRSLLCWMAYHPPETTRFSGGERYTCTPKPSGTEFSLHRLFNAIWGGETRSCHRPLAHERGNTGSCHHFLGHEQRLRTLYRRVDSGEPQQFTPIKSEEDLHSLGGHQAELRAISDLVRYLQDPVAHADSGASVPKGVILSGPPGVGKTLFAKAIAGHAGVPLFLVSAAEFEKKYVGEGEELIRDLFKQAEKCAPCVICIDEFDSVAARRFIREDGFGKHHNSVVNQLLTLLGNDHPGVVVIATTNNYHMLDPAITRPGRFDKHIVLSLPDRSEREHILTIHAQGKKVSRSVSFSDLAAISTGLSGAALEAWVNKAANCAIRQKSAEITALHFDEAFEIVVTGISTKSNPDLKSKSRTATHEAGHALVGHLLGFNLYKVSVRRVGPSFGHTTFIPGEESLPSKQELLDEVCVALAGRAAELVLGEPQAGSSDDIKKAKEIVERMIFDEAMGSRFIPSSVDIEIILQEQLKRAQKIIQENQKTWERIRQALVEHDYLMREDFQQVIDGKLLEQKIRPGESSLSLQLPPKRTKRSLEIKDTGSPAVVEDNKKDNTFTFTKEQVAKALNVDVNKIRKIYIDDSGGCIIRFKPSFSENEHMGNVSKRLRQNDVENFYFSQERELDVYRDGLEDFKVFIRKFGNSGE